MSRLIPVALLSFIAAVLLSVGLPFGAWAAPAFVGLSQACSAGKVSVTISWQGSDTSGKEQWVDYAAGDTGWSAGSFQSLGPLSPSANTSSIDGLPTGTAYTARVNQKLANDSWQPSPTLQFSTISCAAGDTAAAQPGSGGASSNSASGNTPSPTSTPATPSPTPSPVATPTPVPPFFQVIGFADHTSNNGPPSDLTPPGGTVQSCGAFNVYGFVRYTNVRVTTEIIVSWVIGQSSIPQANLVLAPGSGVTIVPFPIQDHTKATYTLQLQLDKDKPPVAAADFTLSC